MSSLQILDRLYLDLKREAKKDKELKPKAENPIIKLIHAYKQRKKDFRVIIEGEAGDGKSSLAQRMGEIMNPKTFIHNPQFAVDRQINFSAKQWMDAVNYLKRFMLNIYDEPIQSGGHHREFMSEANIIITKTVTGFRYKRFITPLCVPTIDMIDKDLTKLCQIMINVFDQGRAEVFRIKRQKFGGDPWFETIIDELRWNMPNQKLWNLYEDKKERDQNERFAEYGHKLKKKEAQDKPNSFYIKQIRDNKDVFIGVKGRLGIDKIMGKFAGISRHRAEAIRASIEIDEAEGQ